MGYFRFQQRVGILPGVHLNLSQTGVSVSVGSPGASVNIGPHGTRETLGLPGTGLSYVETSRTPKARHLGRWLVLAILAVGAVLWALSAFAETVYCSTFAGYRTCSTPGSDYRSTEWENGGRRYGDDNRGNRWTTIPGRYGDTTINRRTGE
jgi:hypothetical protein